MTEIVVLMRFAQEIPIMVEFRNDCYKQLSDCGFRIKSSKRFPFALRDELVRGVIVMYGINFIRLETSKHYYHVI